MKIHGASFAIPLSSIGDGTIWSRGGGDGTSCRAVLSFRPSPRASDADITGSVDRRVRRRYGGTPPSFDL